MIPFRIRFAARRMLNPNYYRRLSNILARPFSFFSTLLMKIRPNSPNKPLDLRLKDGKVIHVREFWTLFLFDEIFVDNCYEPPQLSRLGPFKTIVDVGANIGLYTLRMKQLWPDAQIIAIEPHPQNFHSLVEHIETNHLSNVQAVQAGITDECGCMELYISGRNIGGHSMYKKAGGVSIPVSVLTLAKVLDESNVKDGGILLKIDCEGCEKALITALNAEMAERVACIIFEPENSLYKLDELLQHLRDLGFTISMYSNLVFAERATGVAAA